MIVKQQKIDLSNYVGIPVYKLFDNKNFDPKYEENLSKALTLKEVII